MSMSILSYGMGEKKRWLYPITALIIAAARVVSWALFFPHIQTFFQLETTAAIVLVSMFAGLGSMILGPPVAGFILDKYGPKIPFSLSAVIVMGGYMTLAAVLRQPSWETAWPLWYTGGFLVGFGAGLFTGCFTNIVAKWFPGHVGVPMAFATSGASVGGMVMPPVIGSMIAARGFTSEIFIFLAVLGFCAIVLLGIIPWKMPSSGWKPEGWVAKAKATGTIVQEQKQYTLSEAIHDKRYWIMAAAFTGAAFSHMFFAQNVSLIIIEGLTKGGMERADVLANVVPYYLSLVAFAGLLGRFGWGWILDKLGPFTALPLMYFISGVMIAVFYLGYTSVTFIYIAGCILMFAMTGEGTLHFATVPTVFGQQHIGKIMTTLNAMSVGIGIAFGPTVGAYIRDVTGGFTTSLILAVCLRMLSTAFAIVGFYITRKMKQEEASKSNQA